MRTSRRAACTYLAPNIVAALGAAVVALLLSFAIGTSLPASAAPRGAADLRTAIAIDSPAVVRIVSTIQAQVSCAGCASDGSTIVSPSQGAFEYFATGSGAFVTPDGYILTADHVVDHGTNNSEDANFVVSLLEQDWEQRFNVSQAFVDQYLQDHSSQFQFTIQATKQEVFLSTAYTGQLQNSAQTVEYQLSRIVVNSPVDKQDTALIKVEAHDMPYLRLAPNNSAHVGDSVTAIAYPADADDALNGGNFTALTNPAQTDVNTINSLLSASVNTGQLTAQKSLQDGTPVYEANGIGSQGSSGGPVIDDQGRIVGFVDAGPSTGRLTFLVPSEIIAQYVQQANIANPAPGAFMTTWTRANQEFNATAPCHWTQAYKDLTTLHTNYPEFGALQQMLATAQAKATPNECPAPVNVGAIVAGILIFLLLAAGVAYWYLRRENKLDSVLAAVGIRRSGTPVGAAPRPPYLDPPTEANAPWLRPAPAPAPPPAPPPAEAMPTPTPITGVVRTEPSQPVMSSTDANAVVGVPYFTPTPPSESAAPSPGSPSTDPQVARPTTVRVCTQGHSVTDPAAKFCPECGSPIPPV